VNKSLLDLCCGTGQLAVYFLERGYRVTGIDLSESMLEIARQNAASYLQTMQVKFIRADATHFTLDEPVGLVVSTFDSLNHLESVGALRKCFGAVLTALVSGGLFIFDLNTRLGLMRRCNSIHVDESTPEALVITRGISDGESDRAYFKMSGFLRTSTGLYERFDETVFNTVFEMSLVREALLEAGWRSVQFAGMEDLNAPVADPEKEGRVFIIARK
jgi:SAM-dependent methyltransferase